jgi:hypothetical protein
MPGSQYFPTNPVVTTPTPAPIMNLNPSNAFIAANQTEMLDSAASDNDTCFRSDLNQVFTLIDQPANILTNWKVHPVPAVTSPVPAPTAGAAVPASPVANQIWTNTGATTVASVPAGATAVWTSNAWLVLEKPTVASPTTIPSTSAKTSFLGGTQQFAGTTVTVRNDIVTACSFGTWSAGTLTFSQSGTYEIDISAIISALSNQVGSQNFMIAAHVSGVSKAEATTMAAVFPNSAMCQSLHKTTIVDITAGQVLLMKASLTGTTGLLSGGLGVVGTSVISPSNNVWAEMIVKKLA